MDHFMAFSCIGAARPDACGSYPPKINQLFFLGTSEKPIGLLPGAPPILAARLGPARAPSG